MKLFFAILFFLFSLTSFAFEKFSISFSDVSQIDKKYSNQISSLPSHIAITGLLSWKYTTKRGAIVFSEEVKPDNLKACAMFDISGPAKLIFGSDPHHSCRVVGQPKMMKGNDIFWIAVPVEVNPSGEGDEYIQGVVNLLFDKNRGLLCSLEGTNTELKCRQKLSEKFYRIQQ